MQNDKWNKAYNELQSSPDKCLQIIIDSLKKGQMSVFVGAGFSKNANKAFPDWAELLSDLYPFVYPESSNKTRSQIEDAIKSQGESAFAQRYLDCGKKREALDLFIERKLDPIDKGNKWLYTTEQLLKLNWNDVITTNWDTVLEQANKKGLLNFEEVKSAKQLKNANRKRIIKINGTLRSESEKKDSVYEFDSCYEHLYIITTDDFRNYSLKHEAFSNFMKVKFLEDSFCLIGFSGNDPNFKYWISEIKRVMTNGGDTEIPNVIFLLNYDNKELSEDEKLFFYNNFVINVPVSKLVEVIDKESGEDDVNDSSGDSVFSKLFSYLYDKTSENILLKVDDVSKSSTNLLLRMYRRKAPGFSSSAIKDYNSLPLFTYENLDFSSMLLSNIQYYFMDVSNLKSEDFLFLYRWCLSNFYLPTDIFDVKSCERLIDKFKKDILPVYEENPFIEMVFSIYCVLGKMDFFENFYQIISKTERNIDCYCYQKLLYYLTIFDYKSFTELLEKWTPENNKNKESLFIVRKIRLLYAFNTNFHDELLSHKVLDLFKKAEDCSDNKKEPCIYLHILFYHLNLLYGFSGNKVLQRKIDELKNKNLKIPHSYFEKLTEDTKKLPDAKPNDTTRYSVPLPLFGSMDDGSKNNYFNRRRVLNFFDFTGIPSNFTSGINEFYQLLELLYSYEKKDKRSLLVYLVNSMPFYGNSAEEETVRLIVPQVLRCFDIDFIDELAESILKVVEVKLEKKENPKSYIYFLNEVLKRTGNSIRNEVFSYYTKLIMDKNEIFFALINRGSVWGCKKTFEYYLSNFDFDTDYNKITIWLIENFIEQKNIDRQESYWNPWFSYFYCFHKNIFFTEAIKNIVYKDQSIRNLLVSNLNITLQICLLIYNYLEIEDKEKVKQSFIKNLSLSMDSNFLSIIYDVSIKDKVLHIIKSYIMDNHNISISKVSGFITVLESKGLLADSDYDDIYNLIEVLYLRLIENKTRLTNITYSGEIEKWFYFTAYMDSSVKIEKGLKSKYHQLFMKIDNEFMEIYKDIFDLSWIYGKDLQKFKINTIKIFNYFYAKKTIKKNIGVVNQILSRIATGESKEFEAPLELFINLLDTEHGNVLLKDKMAVNVLKQITIRFDKDIPFYFDDLFITKLMEKLDTKLNSL